MDDRELRAIAAFTDQECPLCSCHRRHLNGSPRCDCGVTWVARTTPQSMTITDELIDRVSKAICRALGHSSYDPYMAASGIQPESECALAAKAALQVISNPQKVNK